MLHVIGAAAVGIACGEGVRRSKLRPLMKSAVKGWLRLSREARDRTETLRMEAEKLINEARTELNEQEGHE